MVGSSESCSLIDYAKDCLRASCFESKMDEDCWGKDLRGLLASDLSYGFT